MTADEIAQVEALVNKEIQAGLEVRTDVMDVEEAKKSGAKSKRSLSGVTREPFCST